MGDTLVEMTSERGDARLVYKKPQRRRRRALTALAVLLAAGVGLVLVPLRYAYEPGGAKTLNAQVHFPAPSYDVWGEALSQAQAERRLATDAGRRELSPAAGAVAIDEALLRHGREAFYRQTFGNEIYLTDVLGLVDGPLPLSAFVKALLELHGRGTSNLRVAMSRDARVGGRFFARGTLIDTGLDVPKGAWAPLGLSLRKVGVSIKVGITCALCHSSVDPRSLEVVDGAANNDLNAGVLLAMASNSAAFFVHTGVSSLAAFNAEHGASIRDSAGRLATLPDPERLEQAVDATLLAWPRGSFDSMVDLVADPSQIPDSFTFEDYPYNWSGGFMAGPFHGLSVQNNNVHALNSDSLTHMDASASLFGIDKELYVATVLQRAASKRYRYEPSSKRKPSEFLAAIDPTPAAPALNEMVTVPTYPRPSLIAPDGFWSSTAGQPIWRDVNAMSAWQNTLVPPRPPLAEDPARRQQGRAIFERAGCPSCHSGPGFTNHRIIPVADIGTEPARAAALHRVGQLLAPPRAFAFDQPVPLPEKPRTLEVPLSGLDASQIALAFANDGKGGYRVPGLLGLYWSAPYLHDGGVAVGRNRDRALGVRAAFENGAPDPAQSLTALVDRELRARVIAANEQDPTLGGEHVRGSGHERWVDAQAGFSAVEQAALIYFLLTLPAPGSSRR
jgi:hypothetical protein